MRRERLTARVRAVTAIVCIAITIVVGVVAFTALVYVRAAMGRRRRRTGCPFEDDDDEARPWLREVADVVRESVTLVSLVLSALRPVPASWRTAIPRAGRGPVVVLVPERGLPVASLASLGRRLTRDLDGASIHAVGGGDEAVRADRLAELVASLAARGAGRVVVLIGHGTGGRVARRAAAVIRVAGLRIVCLATAHDAPHAASLDPTHVVNLYSLHDVLVAPPSRAYLPGAYNIALRDEGHFGIVVRDRPYAILLESLDDVAPRAAAS